jgi:hypothetical protein
MASSRKVLDTPVDTLHRALLPGDLGIRPRNAHPDASLSMPEPVLHRGKDTRGRDGECEGNESFSPPARHHLVAQTVTFRNVARKDRIGKAKP